MRFNKLLYGAIGGTFLQMGSLAAVDQTLHFNVPAVSALALSGDVTFSDFATPAPGDNFAPLSDTSSTYSLSANSSDGATNTITAKLASAAPTGMELTATLAAPTGATASSATVLTTSDQTLVSGLSGGSVSGQSISYSLSADVGSTPPGASSLVVTYTLVSA